MSVRSPDGYITFHDPLAAAVIFDESICGYKRGAVDADLESRRSKGLLYFSETSEGKNQMTMQVDSGKFFNHFFKIVDKKPVPKPVGADGNLPENTERLPSFPTIKSGFQNTSKNKSNNKIGRI